MSTRKQGEILEGKYEILGRLGRGGMGELYRVRHLHLDEVRVIKILRGDLAEDKEAAQRFFQEAKTATSIKHPNVAILYDFSKLPDGSFFMVWEHIEGEDVGKTLRERGPFPVPLALELGIQTLRGLDALHSVGVIHRDISPDNLMITRNSRGQPQVKLIDLGLAKNLAATMSAEITQAGLFLGKLRYCSPEQAGLVAEGAALDPRSDLYSFAAVLYEMVCGLAPFDSETPHGFVFQRLTEDPLPLVGRNPAVEVPAELDAVLRRGLERDRDKRWADAPSLIRALVRISEQLRGAATQEISIVGPGAAFDPSIPVAAALAASAPAAPARPLSAAPPAPPIPPIGSTETSRSRRSSSELSRAERESLLAQINAAGERVAQTGQLTKEVIAALDAGRVESARQLVRQLDEINPRSKGLAELRARLEQADQSTHRAEQVRQAEEMLEGYLRGHVGAGRAGRGGQPQLAGLALETLLELAPNHPHRGDYERRVAALATEADRLRRLEELVEEIRSALVREDLRAARARLEALAQIPGEDAAARREELRREIEETDGHRKRQATLELQKRHIAELLARGRVEEAADHVERLAELEATKVTMDLYRGQLDEARGRLAAEQRTRGFEQRFRERLAARDWRGARDVASELEQQEPGSSLPGTWFAEVSRLDEADRHQQAVEQGISQLERFLASDRLAEAELALKIVVQMAPNHPRRRALERQLGAARKKAG